MSAAKIRKGDKVVVLSGRDKGKTGEVVKSMPEGRQGRRVGRQRRDPSPQADPANPQGGLERKEAPMHVSKVAIADPKDGKATRVRFEMAKDGKKVRVAARSGEKIDG